MLITRFLLLIIIFFSSSTYAKIIQTDDLNQIKQEIFASPKDTLVVFDVDFVLITPSDEVFILAATGDGLKYLSDIYDDFWQRVPKQDLDEIQSVLYVTQPWRTVTPETTKIFNQIKNKGYKVIGLTASGTGALGKIPSMEKWRINQLKSVDITFSQHFAAAKPGALDTYIPSISHYYSKAKDPCFPAAADGIIFTCNIPKGEVLDAYLQHANLQPKKIIFIDDRIKHLNTVEDYCKKHNIQYVGYEYTAVKEQAKNLTANKRKYKLQYEILERTKTWLDDKQAGQVLAIIDK